MTKLAQQHGLNAQRRFAVAEHVGDQAERPTGVARSDGLGQLEHTPLARFWHQLFDLGSAYPAGLADVDFQLFQCLHQAAQIGAGCAGQRLGRVAVNGHAACLGLTGDERTEVAILEPCKFVQETSPPQRQKGAQTAIDLFGQEHQAGAGIGMGGVGNERFEGVGLHLL